MDELLVLQYKCPSCFLEIGCDRNGRFIKHDNPHSGMTCKWSGKLPPPPSPEATYGSFLSRAFKEDDEKWYIFTLALAECARRHIFIEQLIPVIKDDGIWFRTGTVCLCTKRVERKRESEETGKQEKVVSVQVVVVSWNEQTGYKANWCGEYHGNPGFDLIAQALKADMKYKNIPGIDERKGWVCSWR